MSKYVRVNDTDYKVTVNTGGTITLDTGTNAPVAPANWTGGVIITGDLLVMGETTTVETTNLAVEDNIIVINKNETGAGVTEGTAGIQVDRGTQPDAQFLFDENQQWLDTQTGQTRLGGYTFRTDDGLLVGIRTNSITTNGNNLNLIGSGYAVLSVSGTIDYEANINDDDDIPNVRWVDDFVVDYFTNNPPEFIQKGDSVLRIYDSLFGPETVLQLKLDNTISAEFRPARFDTQGIRLASGTISTTTSGVDLTLTALGTGNVVIDDTLKLKIVAAAPAAAVDGVRIYANTQGYGGTGVYFVNTKSTKDEFVSRRKAIAYSMIF